MLVIKKKGQYVAKHDSPKFYTMLIGEAQEYKTLEKATQNLCGGECVMDKETGKEVYGPHPFEEDEEREVA